MGETNEHTIAAGLVILLAICPIVDTRRGTSRSPTNFRLANTRLLKALGVRLVGSGARERGVELFRRSVALNQSAAELSIYLAQHELPTTGMELPFDEPAP
jgi:hypothetical protein